jgi:hypothetical protein
VAPRVPGTTPTSIELDRHHVTRCGQALAATHPPRPAACSLRAASFSERRIRRRSASRCALSVVCRLTPTITTFSNVEMHYNEYVGSNIRSATWSLA